MHRRVIKYIVAALVSLFMIVPTVGSAHAATLCDSACIADQLVNVGLPGNASGIPAYNADRSMESYIGPNGLEIRYGRDATWKVVNKNAGLASGIVGLFLAPEISAAVVANVTVGRIVTAASVGGILCRYLTDCNVSAVAQSALQHDMCLGLTVPPDSTHPFLDRMSQFLRLAQNAGALNIAAITSPAAPQDIKVWFESCSNERASGLADTVSPALGIMSGDLSRATAASAIPVTGGSASTMASLGRDVLTPGQKMYPNQYLTSIDGRFVLALQGDGNLVAYGPGYVPIWSSGTSGRSVDCLLAQADGNVVLYGKNGVGPIWATNTSSSGGASLKMQEDGNLVAYNSNAGAMWSTGTGQGTTGGSYIGSAQLTDNQWLRPGQYMRSADFRYTLFMQSDGNLVLWAPGKRVIWSTGTGGRSGVEGLLQQGDANLVLYAHGAIWSTGLGGPGPHKLLLQNDGNLVVYGSNGGIWSTGTANRI
ncbi:hypothetical protein [Streptomyces sp. NBC_00620]|uniref:hypothetical protein n=1 Tax=Streptomyces sp. NBC_00620 TaxID=2903666 RepID=UPI002259431C|nr:hypothetical protein [Streptomyces sp. NBC_00620]MCX4976261.1 hypothetical protein [Streptomyces sp. NBC_00620]